MTVSTSQGSSRGVAPDGGRAGYADFYRRHQDQVLRALVVTLGDAELARDATQEAMARAWRRWDEVASYANPGGWLYRVGLNWARSRLRRLAREVLGRARTDAQPAPEVADPAVLAAIAELSEEHRAVLVLRFYLDWSIEDVAVALDIPEGTVKSRQHWALRHLRERLEDD